MNLNAYFVNEMKMPNIDVDNSHPNEYNILDDDFLFETIILSDGVWKKRGYDLLNCVVRKI